MSCENYESGIIMKVEVKVIKRDMQRFPKSLGDKDIYPHISTDIQTNTHTRHFHKSKKYPLQ